MEQASISFLEKLCNSFGPSGFEREAIMIVKDYVRSFSDEIVQDKLGSLLFCKNGSSKEPVIMLPGHVDEIGFVVSAVNEKGFLTFNPLGGWSDQVLLAQRVLVRTSRGDVLGIIAAKPPHVIPADERKKLLTKKKMFIDIACSNRREAAEMGVRVGDPVVPLSNFEIVEKKAFETKDGKEIEKGIQQIAMGKAFDDRVGAFIAAEVIRRLAAEKLPHPNRVVGAATVQEEVGVRGATTAGWLAEPDVCITLEVDISGDVPGIDNNEAPAVMGKGPAISTFDASMIPNQILKELVINTAERCGIPYQLSQMAAGGTDAGAVHKQRAGCPSIVLGAPTRHIHSHVAILNLEDVENCIQLVLELVKVIDKPTADGFTQVP